MQEYPNIRAVAQLVEILKAKGVRHIVLSPGSRNAPLTIAFNQSAEIRCHSIIDERSAAYYALGMSQALQEAVAVCCTSGTAALNYYPAIAEAFYQEIPLIVLTADRPPERIDQQDGQTLRQSFAFSQHTRHSTQLYWENGDDGLSRYNQRLINETLNIGLNKDYPGPVHINIPLREPLYETQQLAPVASNILLAQTERLLSAQAVSELKMIWRSAQRILIIPGMHKADRKITATIERLAKDPRVAIISENLANVHSPLAPLGRLLHGMKEEDKSSLQPDLVISYGKGVVNKKIKQWLRAFPPDFHWFVHPGGLHIDTYDALSHVIPVEPGSFLELLAEFPTNANRQTYADQWKYHDQSIRKKHQAFTQDLAYSDLFIFQQLAETASKDLTIQWGNSSPVRYAQLFEFDPSIEHWGNRGTSGIDGQTSTAAGFAKMTDKLVLVVTGDIGFFYDSNGLWNQDLAPNLRILLINNGGGGIFRMIKGPAERQELEGYFETHHNLNAAKMAESFHLGYRKVEEKDEVKSAIRELLNTSEKANILEIMTPRKTNPEVFKAYIQHLVS